MMDCDLAGFWSSIDHAISAYGQAVIGTSGDCGKFSYTIGNAEKGFPELLCIGPFNQNSVCMILNIIGKSMREIGMAPREGITDWRGLQSPIMVRMAGAAARDECTIQAGQRLGHEHYEVLQIVLSDRNGRFPGNPSCDPVFQVPLL